MQAKSIPHSSESILVIIEVLCNMKEFDEAFGRYDDMKSLNIPRDLSFYHQLFRICARQQPSSDYAILELRYQLKREKNIQMNAETIKALLDCCITSKNSEVANQLWQACLDHKEWISKGILSRMKHFWTKEQYQEMKNDWIY
jgi:pentatricopeptide repeat protein